MTHLDDLHALLSERAHLRAQRDELQRDCTRFEAEARAAREELRKMRAATFDPKKSLERIFVENRTLLAELAKAEQDERGADPSTEHTPAAIPSQPECEDIDEPKTIANLLALGRPVIGLRVSVPFSVPPIPATVTSIDTHRDGDLCTILRDDGLSVSYWPRDVYFVKPAPEEKPAYVARWRRCQTLVAWQLIDIAAPLVLSTMREDAEHGQFVATAGMSSFRESFLKECAMLAEDHLRAIGLIPAGPIDRSALNELRRNVDPGTHDAARMATRPHLGTALRRRGNAPRDGTRRRRLRGQWRWRQPDRHWRHPRAMRR